MCSSDLGRGPVGSFGRTTRGARDHRCHRLFFFAPREREDARLGITEDPDDRTLRSEAGEPVCVAELAMGRASRSHAGTSALPGTATTLSFSYDIDHLIPAQTARLYPHISTKTRKKERKKETKGLRGFLWVALEAEVLSGARHPHGFLMTRAKEEGSRGGAEGRGEALGLRREETLVFPDLNERCPSATSASPRDRPSTAGSSARMRHTLFF